MAGAVLILSSAAGTLASITIGSLFGWEYLLLAPVIGSLFMAAAALLINGCTEDEIDRSIRSERLNDRDARLLALLNDCPIRRRPLVIDRDGRIIGGR
jgi:4-hydroxybenzoate polyprenyltransferase